MASIFASPAPPPIATSPAPQPTTASPAPPRVPLLPACCLSGVLPDAAPDLPLRPMHLTHVPYAPP
ncbi:hypothetical protein GCM10010170_002510 [Dactylosporangium salmoneum]|uniref:Uncharacterized protein n=1 Tax=Dactylosporangium salmoneum TaxID=53361 RepID=A0ABN3FD03_9ACTN